MNLHNIMVAAHLAGLGLVTKTYLFDVRRIADDSLAPLVPRGSWVLIARPAATWSSNFLYFYSPKNRRLKLGYQICDEGEWMRERTSNFLFKIAKNNAAFDTYTDHGSTIMNKSFMVGRAVFVLNTRQSLASQRAEARVDRKRFSVEPWQPGHK